MVDIAQVGRPGRCLAWKVSFPSRSHRAAVLPQVFYPHGRLSRFNELPGFLNKLFGAFDDTLPGFFV